MSGKSPGWDLNFQNFFTAFIVYHVQICFKVAVLCAIMKESVEVMWFLKTETTNNTNNFSDLSPISGLLGEMENKFWFQQTAWQLHHSNTGLHWAAETCQDSLLSVCCLGVRRQPATQEILSF